MAAAGLAALAAVGLAPGALAAQWARHPAVAGGLAVGTALGRAPTGAFMAASVEWRRAGAGHTQGGPVGLRLEALGAALGSQAAAGAVASLALAPWRPAVTPYLLGGVGLYAAEGQRAGPLGAHAGAGVRWLCGRRECFAEARRHVHGADLRGDDRGLGYRGVSVPLALGVRF